MSFVAMLLAFTGVVLAESIWHDAGDNNPFTFSLSSDGRPQPLILADGRAVKSRAVEQLYGQPGGFRILDESIDIGSVAWAEAGNFRHPRHVVYMDLSDAAGWPDVPVPGGTIALDPGAGRLKFSEGNFGQPLELVSVTPTPHGAPTGVALRGRYAYLTNGESSRGFQIIDVSDPVQPRLVSALYVENYNHSAPQMEGDVAYVSASTSGFLALDVSNPARPNQAGKFRLPFPATTGPFILCGSQAYVQIGNDESTGGRRGLEVEWQQTPDPNVVGWHALDLSVPTRPVDVGLVAKDAPLPDFYYRGVAYRGSEQSLDVLDLAVLRSPKVARSFPLPAKPARFAATGDFLYVLLGNHRVAIFFAGRFEQRLLAVSPPLAGLNWPGLIAASGHHLFVPQVVPEGRPDPGALLIYDLGDPGRPRCLARLVGRHFSPSQVAVVGTRAVMTDGNFGLWSVDFEKALQRARHSINREVQLALPSEVSGKPGRNAQPAGLCPTAGKIQSLRLAGDLAIASLKWGGMEALIDVRQPQRPTIRGFWRNGPRSDTDLATGRCFYIKAWAEPFYRIVDCSDPGRPREAGRFGQNFSCPMRAAGDHGFLFVNGSHEGQPATFLEVYNLRRPAQPMLLGRPKKLPPEFTGPYANVLATTSRVYAVKQGFLAVFGVSDPYHPVALGKLEDAEIRVPTYTWQGAGRILGLHGRFLYLMQGVEADNDPRLFIYDVGNPQKIRRIRKVSLKPANLTAPPPSLGGASEMTGWRHPASNLVISGPPRRRRDQKGEKLLNAADPESTQEDKTLDLSSKERWFERRPIPMGAFVPDFFIEGNFLYAADYRGGVTIYDLQNEAWSLSGVDRKEPSGPAGGGPDGTAAQAAPWGVPPAAPDDTEKNFNFLEDAEPRLTDNEYFMYEFTESSREGRGSAARPRTITHPGYDVIGWNIGELYGDYLLCPKLGGLQVYRVRRSPEIPSGRLTLESVPEWERFRNVITYVESSMVALEEASAAAILIRQRGRTLLEWYQGRHAWSPDARPVDAQSRFPIWSVTKTHVATALGMAIDAGKVRLDDPVCRVIPEFIGEGKEKITFRHLATHTSGLPGDGDWRELKLVSTPGEKIQYSNPGMNLLAHAAARLLGEPGFGQALENRLFRPLGLNHSGFLSPGDDETLIVRAVKTPHDEGWLDHWGPEGRGMAGLYVSARDFAAYGEMYLHGGRGNGRRILKASTVRLLTTSQMPDALRTSHPNGGCSWEVKGDWKCHEVTDSAPPGSFGHGGGTHCYILVCPTLDLVAVKLLNRGYWPATFDYSADYRKFGDRVLEVVKSLGR